MKAGNGQHFEQSYNAQAAVEVDSRLIVGERVSQAPNDKQELVPSVAAIAQPVASVAAVLIDSGFYSEAAVQAVERTGEGQPTGTIVYAAVEKKEHHRTVSDLEQKPEPEVPGPEASTGEVMRYRLRTRGRAEPNTNCGSRRWNRCLGSSRASWAFASFCCGVWRKCSWNGSWSAWPITSSGCIGWARA